MTTRVIRILPFAGIAVIVFALAKLHARYVGEYDLTGSGRFAWTLAYIATSCLIAYGLGIPDQEDSKAAARSSLIAAVSAPLAFGLLQLAVGDTLLPRFVVVLSAPCFFTLFLVSGAITRRSWGAAAESAGVIALLDELEEREFVPDLSGPLQRAAELRVVCRPADVRTTGELTATVRSTGATLLILGSQALDDDELLAEAAELHANGLRVRDVLSFYEEWIGKIPHRELGQAVLMFDIAEVHKPGYRRGSRLLDIAVAAVALIPLALAAPFVAVGNLIGNRGPLLYRQPRVGRDGHVFEMLKFRSMRPGASTGQWTTTDDQRITMFGRVLRLSHLDELPQVINILKGDLSVVGPRPEQPQYVDLLSAKIPYLPTQAPRATRTDGLGPGQLSVRRRRERRAGEAAVRVLVSPSPELAARPSYHRSHDPSRSRLQGSMNPPALMPSGIHGLPLGLPLP